MGIGYEGKTLKEMLDERDRLTRETGCYGGVEKLELHEQDPAKMTRFNSRILNGAIYCREKAKLVSASPTTRTFGECVWSLLVPAGDAVVASLGLVGHTGSAPYYVRTIADYGYEEDCGIRPGDIFETNDPRCGAMHAVDNYTLIPIFYGDELIGWSFGMIHIMDCGAPTPSIQGMAPNSFCDGWVHPPIKAGENDKLFKWWELQWLKQTRTGGMNVLDNKSRVVGCQMLRDLVLEVVEEFGIDYYRRAVKEILERERRRILDRIREQTVPGTFQRVTFHPYTTKGMAPGLFPESDRSWVIPFFVEMTIKPDAHLILDFDGSAAQGEHNLHVSEPPLNVGLSLWWFSQLVYSLSVNTAFNYIRELRLPKGSIVNASNPFAGTTGAVCMGPWYATNLRLATDHALFARGVLEECLTQDYAPLTESLSGVFDNGVPWIYTDFSFVSAYALGARAYKDGDFCCGAPVNPQSDLGELEEWGLYCPPQIPLFRKIERNVCGHGKYRGSLAHSEGKMIIKPGRVARGVIGVQSAATLAASMGMCGAYPGYGGWGTFIHDTNLVQLMKQEKRAPGSYGEMMRWLKEGKLKAGKVVHCPSDTSDVRLLKEGDIIIQVSHSNMGWGDPLARDPELIEKDVNEGWISPEVAKGVYGGDLRTTDGRWKVDLDGTRENREKLRQKRKARGVPCQEWWRREREQVLKKEFSEDIYDMYKGCLSFEKFRNKFYKFWQLPQDYNL